MGPLGNKTALTFGKQFRSNAIYRWVALHSGTALLAAVMVSLFFSLMLLTTMHKADIDVMLTGFEETDHFSRIREIGRKGASRGLLRSTTQSRKASALQTAQAINPRTYPNWHVTVMYGTHGNVLTTENLRTIATFEQAVHRTMEYNESAMLDSLGITPISSFIQYLAPTIEQRTIYFNGLNTSSVITDGRIQLGVRYALKNTKSRWFFSDNFNLTNLSCTHMRSEMALGAPVLGYPNPIASSAEQKAYMKPRALALRNRFLAIWGDIKAKHPNDLELAWGGDFITEDEIIDILVSDALWSIPSFIVVLLYCLYHLRSGFLAFFSVFLLLISFPASLTIYFWLGATYLGALNVLSFYIMLGIGVDDIFVFSSTFFFARRPPAPPRIGIAADEFLADNTFRLTRFIDDTDDEHSLVLQFGEDVPYLLSWYHGDMCQLERLPLVKVVDDTILLGTWNIKIKEPEGAQLREMLQRVAVFCSFAEIPTVGDGLRQGGWNESQKRLKKEILEKFVAPTATIDRIEAGVLHADYNATGTLDAREHVNDGIALDQRLAYTMRTAGSALFVTSATTAMAFLSNFVSSIPAVRAFGELMCILVIMNYLLTVLVFPTGLAFWMVYMRGRTVKQILRNMWFLITCNGDKIEYNLIRVAMRGGEGIESNPPSTPTLVTGEVADGIEMQSMAPLSPADVELVSPHDFGILASPFDGSPAGHSDFDHHEYSSPGSETNLASSPPPSSHMRQAQSTDLISHRPSSPDHSYDSESSYETEIIPGEGLAFKVIGLSGALVRKERELSSEPVGDLETGDTVIVREIWKNRARLISPLMGWVSLSSGLGGSILARRESSDVLSSYDEHDAEESSDADDEDTMEDAPLIRQMFDKVLWQCLKRFRHFLMIAMMVTILIAASVASTLQLQDKAPQVFPSWHHIRKYRIQDETYGSSGLCMASVAVERCSPWYTEPRELAWHVDCAGVLYGNSIVDECNVCGGSGKSCLGCDGRLHSNMVWACGLCQNTSVICIPSQWMSVTLKLSDCSMAIDPSNTTYPDYKIEFLNAFIADVTMAYRTVTSTSHVSDEFAIKDINTCSDAGFRFVFQVEGSVDLGNMTAASLSGKLKATESKVAERNITVEVLHVDKGLSDTTGPVYLIPEHSKSSSSGEAQTPPGKRPLETFSPLQAQASMRYAVALDNEGTTILIEVKGVDCAIVAESLKGPIEADMRLYAPNQDINEYNFNCTNGVYTIYLWYEESNLPNLRDLHLTNLLTTLNVEAPSLVEMKPGHVFNNSNVPDSWPISDTSCVNHGEPVVIVDGKKSKTCTVLQLCKNGSCSCKGLLTGPSCTECDSSCTAKGGECTSTGWCRWCDGRVSQTIDQFNTLNVPKIRDACNVCGSAIELHDPKGTSFVGGAANGTCRGCDGVINSNLRYDLCQVCGGNSDCLVSSLNLERAINVYYLWGIDLENSEGDYTGTNQFAAYDPRFRPESQECQVQMLDICQSFEKRGTVLDQHVLQAGTECFMTSFKEWILQQKRSFPVVPKDYTELLYMFMTSSQDNVDKYSSMIGFDLSTNTKEVKYVMFKFKSSEKVSIGPSTAKTQYNWWEGTVTDHNRVSGCGSGVYQTSPTWPVMFLELSALRTLVTSLVISGLSAVVVVVGFTRDIWITTQVMITIVGIVLGTLMSMRLANYEVGPVEAVAFSAVIGLAVDYTVHFAHCWGQYWKYLIRNGHADTTASSVIYRMVLDLGTPLLNAALTTILSTSFLFATTIVPLSEFATVLVVSTTWSIFFSVFLFLPFLLSFPPSPWWRELQSSMRIITSYSLGGIACATLAVIAYYYIQTMP
eukprot:TRINITY_DN949_c3_g4_i1.p1 TRINITY_DN949_c3_g4~~TRINITY_DN949_c3_g4_i1.p1  ORF type:complete len:1848 (+),score=334.77 TRINITY_DN949_c3_g4_i1:80-5545(+)